METDSAAQSPLSLNGVPLVEPTGSASLSTDGQYRYALTRRWSSGAATVVFMMLNPSTADASRDDPTIRRCAGFARREGASGLIVVNLYAFRATRPADLWTVSDPVGPDNDAVLASTLTEAASSEWPVISAWGAHARPQRVRAVTDIAQSCGARLLALGVTRNGSPRHPLYLPKDSPLTPWEPPRP